MVMALHSDLLQRPVEGAVELQKGLMFEAMYVGPQDSFAMRATALKHCVNRLSKLSELTYKRIWTTDK